MNKITLTILTLMFIVAIPEKSSANTILPPSINCPADINISNDPGVCGAIIDYIGLASATDPEDGDISAAIITTVGPSSGSLFPVGFTQVELSVTDSEGNTVSCLFNVTVTDTEPPTINCPADITSVNDPGVCGATITYEVTGDDNCGGGSNFDEITTTFANNNGQSGIMFDVTASGTEDVSINGFLGHMGPSFGAQNVDIWYMVGSHVGFESDATPWIFHESVNATDNGNTGPGGNVVTPLASPIVIPVGMTYGIFYITDGPELLDYTDGTTSYSDAFVTVDSGSGKALGSATAFDGLTFTPRIFNGTIYYSTGSIQVTQTSGLSSGSVFPVGTTTNTYEITDAAGNTVMCSFDVTITDTEAPTATCPGNQTVNTDPGMCSAVVTYSVPTADNCPGESILQTAGLASGSVFPEGTTTNSFVITDAAGLTTTCTFDVIVQDVEPPAVNCTDITVALDAAGNATITEGDINGGSTDNCGIASSSIDINSFDCNNLGANNVTLSVTDIHGNTATCVAVVTVIDVDAPTAVCQDITVQLDASGSVTILPSAVDGGSSDQCAVGMLSLDEDTFTCDDLGPNMVTLVVTDTSGNSSNCTAIVTVEDAFAPVASCQDISVTLGPGGTVSIIADDINDGSTDNCGAVTASIDIDTFDCSNIGPNNVTLTVTDSQGNSSSCVAVVIVIDDVSPQVICQDITVALDATGSVTITPNDIDNGSSDNCGIASMTLNNSTFTCFNVGIPNNVVLTVTDNFGNASTCNATVTVIDDIPIEVICQDITVTLDNDGEVTIQPGDIDGGSFDNCGISNITASQTLFTCADVGPNDVTLTVTNSNGEQASCIAVVTVQETILPPTAICQNVTAPVGPDGIVTISAASVNNNSEGIGCNGSISLDIDTFTCDDIGPPIPVVLTVMNEDGVTDTCTALVHVVDSIDPTITCPDTQNVTSEGLYELPDYFATGDVVVTDNCENNLTITQIPPPGTLLSQGGYNITMTVTDPSENTATCVFQLYIDDLLGTSDQKELSSILLYPNPADQYLYLANPQGIAKLGVSIYDIGGRLIKELAFEETSLENRIDISSLASASYVVVISSEEGLLTKQLVKE